MHTRREGHGSIGGGAESPIGNAYRNPAGCCVPEDAKPWQRGGGSRECTTEGLWEQSVILIKLSESGSSHVSPSLHIFMSADRRLLVCGVASLVALGNLDNRI